VIYFTPRKSILFFFSWSFFSFSQPDATYIKLTMIYSLGERKGIKMQFSNAGKLWMWRFFVSIVLACSFVIPAEASNDFSALVLGIWFSLLSFTILRFFYRKLIFKSIFGYKWSPSREEFINKAK
jgi:hypothetical protein